MQDIRQLFIVTDELQQWLPVRAGLTDSKKVFCCRIKVFNKQVFVDYDDTRAQAVDDAVAPRWAVATIGFFLAGFVCVRR